MVDPSRAVLALSALNLLLFAIAARLAFDSRESGSATHSFVGAFVALCALLMGYLYWYEATNWYRLVASCAGLLLAEGVFLAAWLSILGQRFTFVMSKDAPRHLLTAGIYRYVRHPFYTAYILTCLAMSLACNHLVGLVCALLVAALYTFAALTEERKFARSPLGAAYLGYRRRTGMFVPRFWAKSARVAVEEQHGGGPAPGDSGPYRH